MASSLVAGALGISQTSETGPGPAANYYIINTTIPVLVVGFNVGLKLSNVLPFGSTGLLAALLGITFTLFYITEYKEMRADEKIAEGHFRKFLPPRLKSPRKSTSKSIQIQMAEIEEADS